MATIRSYTTIEQSKVLAEILPMESADMYYAGHQSIINPKEWEYGDTPKIRGKYISFDDKRIFYPCWSLAALISVTRNYCTRFELTLRSNKKYNLFAMTDNYVYRGFNEYPDGIDEPIDACIALIKKLHELKNK